ncbi:transcriptional regulator, GntR family protein [Salipiger bermudensis HTCC2601]|uniref:Transcriptional regulator, GntR family protein n=1 Tax=Salipiger bermudensis (strain DSM 26914 / JCM 13377 / KCTC 12554 / HTCC2601) TaxID=314265 RepID=Q0FPN1_SALBH|nr:transcriptional regulator, GntR family protein [Salipiger bermudensis HTCC2601]
MEARVAHPLDRFPSLTETLVQAVLQVAREERLGPGDRLPSIKALSERFGVSVPTMREALQRVANLGAVEIRHGSGIYLTRTRLPVITGHPDALQGHDQTLLHLLDARLAIEPAVAAKAARNITDPQAEALREAIEAAERALSGAGGEHKANMSIHARIAEAADNPILTDTILSLIKVFGAEQKRILAMHDRPSRERNHADHVAICDAIIAREPEAAESAMQKHLSRVLAEIGGARTGKAERND